MKNLRKIYRFSLFGALGGLVASLLHQLVLLDLATPLFSANHPLIYDALLGVLIGAPIGFFPILVEVQSRYGLGRALRLGGLGAILGALGGAVAVPVSELLHNQLGGGIQGRATAVGLLGLAVGIAAAISGGSRWWRGPLGGLTGGVLAGVILELLLEHRTTYSDAAILAMILLGLSISLCVALFVNVFTEAWLEGLPPTKVAGHIFHLSRYREPNEAILGSDTKAGMYIWIAGAQPRHAAITLLRSGARIRHIAREGETLVNGNPIAEHILKENDELRVGPARFRYRERNAAREAPSTGPASGKEEGRKVKVHSAVTFKLILIGLALAATDHAWGANTPKVKITAIQMLPAKKVRVYVSLTGSNGEPLPDSLKVRLELKEQGRLVSSQTLSEGWSVDSVLVLDLSGSMRGEKLARAKEAAKLYVADAPDTYRIAVIGFADHASIVCPFTRNKNLLETRIDALSAGGNTALQDAIGSALEMLEGESRKALLVVTDGRENKSVAHAGTAGREYLIDTARKQSVTITAIGLGADVDAKYLQAFEATGGSYLQAPSPTQLAGLFQRTVRAIASEKVIEYESQLNADGLRDALEADLTVEAPGGAQQSVRDQHRIVAPGFIPAVKGNLAPYTLAILLLMAVPGMVSLGHSATGARRFRRIYLRILNDYSPYAGTRDPNGIPLERGRVVVVCPSCERPHDVRSWRNNRCACMLEPRGKGEVCYHRTYPGWLRRFLDFLSHRRTKATGREWLCRCAGDKDGY